MCVPGELRSPLESPGGILIDKKAKVRQTGSLMAGQAAEGHEAAQGPDQRKRATPSSLFTAAVPSL